MSEATVAIIGAGFSGTLLALHLHRHCPSYTRIVLIERNQRFGCGVAYATDDAAHLLNVPAGRMSAFPDQPNHFLDWLRSDPVARRYAPPGANPGSFVSRNLYGIYLRKMLKQARRRRDPLGRLQLVNGAVTAMRHAGDGLRVTIDGGWSLYADYVVLASGAVAPASPPIEDPSFYATPFYRADPWARDALAGLDPDAPVLLLGTGLTSVDMTLSLLDRGHRGTIHALSRRGLLPRDHITSPGLAVSPRPETLPRTARGLLRWLRERARMAEASGSTWRAAVDALRPASQDIWQSLPKAEQRRFLRHARVWWDVHRHRMAPAVAARIAAAREERRFQIHAGRIRSFTINGDNVTATFLTKRSRAAHTLTVGRVLNCTGAGADWEQTGDPIVRSLLDSGLGRGGSRPSMRCRFEMC